MILQCKGVNMLDDILKDNDVQFYDPMNDETIYKVTDTRKEQLTLSILNKLRKYREMKERDLQKRDELVAMIYNIPTETANM